MASEFIHQASCIHKSNEGSLDVEGVGIKSSSDKVQWDLWTHGETGTDCCFVDERSFGIKCNSDAMGSKDSQQVWKKESGESDWLYQEMEFWEFNDASDRLASWLDLGPTRNPFYGDEHGAEIMSTFTAVAALYRDWSLLEKDTSDAGTKSNPYPWIEKYGDFWDHEPNSTGGTESLTSLLVHSDCLGDYSLDLPMEQVWTECHRNQIFHHCLSLREHVCDLAHAMCVKALKDESLLCGRNNLENDLRITPEEDAGMSGNSQQPNSKCVKNEDDFVQAEILNGSNLTAADGFNDCIDNALCSIFGQETSAASRFSFRRDGSKVFTELSGTSPKNEDNQSLSCSVQNNGSKVQGYILEYNDKEVEYERKSLMAKYHISGHWKELEWVTLGADDVVPEGLLYALSYMNLYDLLKMEQVCKYLRNRIKSDVLLWQQLHVELPMSNNLTDEILLELALRSRGQLRCLSLVDCTRITEAALEEIVFSNPKLVKLALPGCSRISADAVVKMVEGHMNLKSAKVATLRQLRVRNMDGFTKEHLDKLQKIFGVKTREKSNTRKLQFYHQKHHASFQDDDRAIDVEVCPKCTNVRLVYDCTRERCRQKKDTGECRACILCIVRCEACGRCITDNDYEETFALDVLCSCCWLGSPKCGECVMPDICGHVQSMVGAPETKFDCYKRLPETEG